MSRRPRIEVVDRNPYGDDVDPQAMEDAARDSTFIEGYSDVRSQRELDVRDGKQPAPLKHRLQWARAKSFDGTRSDGRRMMHWQVDKHYETLKYDDAIKMGYLVDKNPAITKGPDGLAYLGERVLMYATGPVAAANKRKVDGELAEQTQRAANRMEDAVERFNRDTKGAHAQAFNFIGEDPDKKRTK